MPGLITGQTPPSTSEVTKHHSHSFLDTSDYKLYSFTVLEVSSLLVRLNPYLLPERYISVLFNMWMFKGGMLLLGLHQLSSYNRLISSIVLEASVHTETVLVVLQCTKPPSVVFKF